MIHLNCVTLSFISFPPWKVRSSFSPASFILFSASDLFESSITSVIHGTGMAHRDVKPKNLLLERRDLAGSTLKIPGQWSKFPFSVRICDFGVCFVDQSQKLTPGKFRNSFGVSYRFSFSFPSSLSFFFQISKTVFIFLFCLDTLPQRYS